MKHLWRVWTALIITSLLVIGCKKDDDDNGNNITCDNFDTSSIYISGTFTNGMYSNMTRSGNDWVYEVSQLMTEELSFIFANNSSGNIATWGAEIGSSESERSGMAVKKVSSNGNIICGDNTNIVINESLLNRKVIITFNPTTQAYSVSDEDSDACDNFGKNKFWVHWRVDETDAGSFGFEEMTEIASGIFEVRRNNFNPCCGAHPFKIVNTNDFTQADWGREEGFSPDPNFDPLTRKAGRKVIDPIFENGVKVGENLICGGNTNIRIPTAESAGKNIRLIFDMNTEEYTWIIEEPDPCEDINRTRIWAHWRVDETDPGSFGFEEMEEFEPGVFQIIRQNFQACCPAHPVKFVNTDDFTQADWGREPGFSPDPNFDPLNRVTGRKVIDPVFENGVKVGEDLICGGNGNIRFPTEGTSGKTIRLIFDTNTEEYTWITQD